MTEKLTNPTLFETVDVLEDSTQRLEFLVTQSQLLVDRLKQAPTVCAENEGVKKLTQTDLVSKFLSINERLMILMDALERNINISKNIVG